MCSLTGLLYLTPIYEPKWNADYYFWYFQNSSVSQKFTEVQRNTQFFIAILIFIFYILIVVLIHLVSKIIWSGSSQRHYLALSVRKLILFHWNKTKSWDKACLNMFGLSRIINFWIILNYFYEFHRKIIKKLMTQDDW